MTEGNTQTDDMVASTGTETVEVDDNNQEKLEEQTKRLTKTLQNINLNYDELKEDYFNKEFLIDITMDNFKKLREHLGLHSPWKYEESLILLKTLEDFDEIINIGNNDIYLFARHITSANSFLAKYEGCGEDAAKEYKRFLQPLNNALGEVQKLEKEIEFVKSERQKIEYYLNSAKEGYFREDADAADTTIESS